MVVWWQLRWFGVLTRTRPKTLDKFYLKSESINRDNILAMYSYLPTRPILL